MQLCKEATSKQQAGNDHCNASLCNARHVHCQHVQSQHVLCVQTYTVQSKSNEQAASKTEALKRTAVAQDVRRNTLENSEDFDARVCLISNSLTTKQHGFEAAVYARHFVFLHGSISSQSCWQWLLVILELFDFDSAQSSAHVQQQLSAIYEPVQPQCGLLLPVDPATCASPCTFNNVECLTHLVEYRQSRSAQCQTLGAMTAKARQASESWGMALSQPPGSWLHSLINTS